MAIEVKHYKVRQLPSSPTPNSIYWVKASTDSEVSGYITDLQGVPYPLKDISGSGGIQSIVNSDGNITVTGSDNLVINISPALLSIINSALQSGNNISELFNDAGYITSFTETDPIFQASEASLFVTGDKVNLDNQSGVNSGDETTLSIQTKRPLKTINGESLEGSGNIIVGSSITNTSELTNDGSDGTSTYVETDELGQVAFSNDYNDLDNLPTIPVVSTLLREEFVFSGSQTFTLTNNYAQVYLVEVQGQGALSTSQYTLVAPNQVTINDTLDAGDYVVIIYSDASAGVVPYYTQAQTDAGFIATVPNFVYVRDVNDFPPITLDKYFLEDDKTYHLAGTIDLNGARLVGGSNTTIIGGSSENGILTSTGLPIGVPLLSSIYTTPIRHISFKDVHTAIEFDGSTNPNDMALDWTGVNFVNVPNVGLVKDAVNFIFDKGAFLDSKNLKFDGTIDTVGFGNSLLSGDGLLGDILKVEPTCIITRRFRIIYSPIVSFGLTRGVNIDVNATIPIESFILDTANFSGRAINSTEYLPGINYQDGRALFVNCVGIINTTAIANMYMKNNATPTTISVIGDRYAMSGTTQSNGVNQKFTHIPANNSMRYDSTITRLFRVLITFAVESGNNNILGIYVGVKRGVSINPTADRISESEVYLTTSGTRPEVGAVQALVELNQNDEVYMIVQNTSALSNITVEFMNMIIERTN
jgi:hypothetical protein